jgi:hypothetical protein
MKLAGAARTTKYQAAQEYCRMGEKQSDRDYNAEH